MADKIEIENCSFELGAGEGICVPADTRLKLKGSNFKIGTGRAIHFRDAQSFFQSLGFPPDTPPNLLLEALRIMEEYKSESAGSQKRALEKTRLFSWLLDRSVDVTDLASNLTQLAQSGVIPLLLQYIGRM